MTIGAFYRHGMLADEKRMRWLAGELHTLGGVKKVNNETYQWKGDVIESGLELADTVLPAATNQNVLLVGHSQGGLVCRVAAIALTGTLRPRIKEASASSRILEWQRKNEIGPRHRMVGVVTIATPNAGAFTFGQLSVVAEHLAPYALKEITKIAGIHNLEDLTTPRLFREFQHWTVPIKYMSISGTQVSRYSRDAFQGLRELVPWLRAAIRFDIPNDGVVEDSSTDLRQSLIPPEVDLDRCYRHVRAYPESIELDHSEVLESPDVRNVILDNLRWLFS